MHTYINLASISIPSYGLCMMIAVMLCGFLIVRKACTNGITFEDIMIILAVSLGAALLCGGGLYILISYTPKQIFYYLKELDFSFIFNGGLVFYGGLIGGILGGIISRKILNVSFESLERSAVPYIPLGHAIGRIGCLMAGCCYGFEYNGIFAVKNELLFYGKTYFPIQAVEAIFNLLIMWILLLYEKKKPSKYNVLVSYLLMYSVLRFFIEFFRGDKIRGEWLLFSTSQWISVIIISICIAVKLLQYKKFNEDINIRN